MLYRYLVWLAIFSFAGSLALCSSVAHAQDVGMRPGGAASYLNDYSRPGEATIIINVWGSAGQPGLWRVERDVDLIDLLSVIGVPAVGSNSAGTRSKEFVAIYRIVNGERREVYRRRLKTLLEDGESYPSLQNKDVLAIEVEQRRRIGLTTFSTLVGTASSLTLLILNLTRN